MPPADVAVDLEGYDDPARRVLCATYGDVRVFNLYVPNGQSVGSEKYDYKLAWLAALDAHLRRDLKRHKHVVAVGDFNIAPDDRDVHDPVQWEGKILCSPRERSALGGILKAGFKDTFRLFEQEEKSFQLVGLPRRRVSQEQRPANRPDTGVGGHERCLHRVLDRRGAAQITAAIRSHARGGRVRAAVNAAADSRSTRVNLLRSTGHCGLFSESLTARVAGC